MTFTYTVDTLQRDMVVREVECLCLKIKSIEISPRFYFSFLQRPTSKENLVQLPKEFRGFLEKRNTRIEYFKSYNPNFSSVLGVTILPLCKFMYPSGLELRKFQSCTSFYLTYSSSVKA